MLASINAAREAKARGLVTLRDLCEEFNIEPRAARARLRKAGIRATDGTFAWVKDSDDLKKVHEVFA
jgi:hypothetical protein